MIRTDSARLMILKAADRQAIVRTEKLYGEMSSEYYSKYVRYNIGTS